MRYTILLILLCFCVMIDSFAAENKEIVNSEQINKILDIDNFKKSDKEQELLNIYKERLNLLSYKERQLNSYENSLKALKSEVELLHVDLEKQQQVVDQKEIELLKKELSLKEKERDLEQLEEKLAQVDNVQLARQSNKPSSPSVILKTDLQLDTSEGIPSYYKESLKDNNFVTSLDNKSLNKETKSDSKNSSKVKKNRYENVKNKINVPYINSGLGEMKKDRLTDMPFRENDRDR